MGAIKLSSKGDLKKFSNYLEKLKGVFDVSKLDKYGKRGVDALKAATPVDSGNTADSWYYEKKSTKGEISLSFWNKNVQNGVPIAIILQYGHATGNGGYVQGRDYINPAIQPIFDEMARELWREVKKA